MGNPVIEVSRAPATGFVRPKSSATARDRTPPAGDRRSTRSLSAIRGPNLDSIVGSPAAFGSIDLAAATGGLAVQDRPFGRIQAVEAHFADPLQDAIERIGERLIASVAPASSWGAVRGG